MAMSPDEVRNKTFHIAKRGYERGEVHRFLDGIASELETIRVAAEGDATDAVVVEAETVEDVAAEVVEATPAESDSATVTTSARGSDDFDRVGNEISLMLRQAQESALKIRSDAEVEASTLVDQVRLDIEADRSAHEQAAQELIARTEDRAASLRREAETYSEDTRRSADDYASARRSDADAIRREVEIAAETDRKQASDRLAAASIEAEATMNEAQARAERLVIDAETEAQNRADAMLRLGKDAFALAMHTQVLLGDPASALLTQVFDPGS